jgi:hypothetical protein
VGLTKGKLVLKQNTYSAQSAESHSYPPKSQRTSLILMAGRHSDPEDDTEDMHALCSPTPDLC